MKEKIKKIFKEILNRIKSPATIAGLAATITMIASISGIDLKTITTWGMLWEDVLMIISNPYVVGSIIVQVFAYLNNPTNKTQW
jgi:hypothetical protein